MYIYHIIIVKGVIILWGVMWYSILWNWVKAHFFNNIGSISLFAWETSLVSQYSIVILYSIVFLQSIVSFIFYKYVILYSIFYIVYIIVCYIVWSILLFCIVSQSSRAVPTPPGGRLEVYAVTKPPTKPSRGHPEKSEVTCLASGGRSVLHPINIYILYCIVYYIV